MSEKLQGVMDIPSGDEFLLILIKTKTDSCLSSSRSKIYLGFNRLQKNQYLRSTSTAIRYDQTAF